jgi:shikimate 5-dehydrogenase
MADAYGAKRKKKAALLVGAGGATVAAAMAGRKYAPQMARSVGPAIGRVLRSAVM